MTAPPRVPAAVPACAPGKPAPLVFVSVLNWNSADTTVACIDAALATPTDGLRLRFVVLDNGSRAQDWTRLQAGLAGRGVELIRLDENAGFAAGHNVVIRRAQERQADFVWLLNNDTLVEPDVLPRLVAAMASDPRCGAVSPVIYALHDERIVDFCGAVHDWPALASRRPSTIEVSRQLEASRPAEMWVHGTAVLLRMAALREVGLLDESLFAYYEDDDIGVRLSRAGWSSRMSFDSAIRHVRRASILEERPAYYFYLMARNSMLFWLRHAPAPHRRLIRVRLLARTLIDSANLRQRGHAAKSDACLAGAADGLRGRAGKPRPDQRPPWLLVLAARVLPWRLLSRLQ